MGSSIQHSSFTIRIVPPTYLTPAFALDFIPKLPKLADGKGINMKKQIGIISAVIFSLVLGLSAQTEDFTMGLGLGAGMISGSGFSYRHFKEDKGYQVNLSLLSGKKTDYYSSIGTQTDFPDTSSLFQEFEPGRETSGSLGLQLFHILHRTEKSRFYLFYGAASNFKLATETKRSYQYVRTNSVYEAVQVGTDKTETTSDMTIYAGVGLGMEFRTSENVRLSLELPLTFSSKMDIYMYVPQVSVHYYFK